MSKNLTLTVTDDIHVRMKEHPEIKWSEIARSAIESRLEMLDTLNAIASKSKLSEKDVKKLADSVKRGMANRHGLAE